MEKKLDEFTKYERARILGARALQISMDAPILLRMTEEEIKNLNHDSLKIAQRELDEGILPISINRPFPERKEAKLKAIKKEIFTTPDQSVSIESNSNKEEEFISETEQEFESEKDEERLSELEAD